MRIIKGIIASQPITVNMRGFVVAFVLIKTDEGYQKFFCKTDEQPNMIDPMINTPFANLIVSSVGDNVRIRVFSYPSGQLHHEIKNFINDTRSIGYL